MVSLFGTNKYINWYISLINKRRQHILEVNYETHHIIPQSLGGDNTLENLVRLTVREHYIAHLMLYHASKHINNKQIYYKQLYSLNAFVIQKRNIPLIIPSVIVEKIRSINIARLAEVNKRTRSDDELKKFKNNHWTKMGLDHPMLNKKHSVDARKRMSENSAKWFCKAISPEGNVTLCKSTHELARLINTNADTIKKFCNTNEPVPIPGKRYISQSTPERLNAVGWLFFRQTTPF